MSCAKSRKRSWVTTSADCVRWLQAYEVGAGRSPNALRIPPAKLADLMRLLLMLLQNGLSLPKALNALCDDRAAKRWNPLLRQLGRSVQQGGSLSAAMKNFPRTFTTVQVQQIRVGERTGALQRSLEQLCQSLERSVATRRNIIKKLSYPVLIMVAGLGLVTFMITYVVPEFEEVFSGSGVALPMVTRFVSAASRGVFAYGPAAIGAIISTAVILRMVRSKPRGKLLIDAAILRIPILGGWIRDAAALQFADSMMSMIESGFTPVEAVEASVACVHNCSVKAAVTEVCLGVKQGERLSKQMEQFPALFPATLCQLINVGEQSGDFGNAMVGACRHLRQQLERRIDASVSLIEPILTLSLAVIIGTVVMSIYMPMFHMFEVLE